MKTTKQRLPYFLLGLFIGILFLVFFLDKKNATFDYGANARVLKNIQSKRITYTQTAKNQMQDLKIDSVYIHSILKNGDVDLWNKIKNDSCMIYAIRGEKPIDTIEISVANYESKAIVLNVKKLFLD